MSKELEQIRRLIREKQDRVLILENQIYWLRKELALYDEEEEQRQEGRTEDTD